MFIGSGIGFEGEKPEKPEKSSVSEEKEDRTKYWTRLGSPKMDGNLLESGTGGSCFFRIAKTENSMEEKIEAARNMP